MAASQQTAPTTDTHRPGFITRLQVLLAALVAAGHEAALALRGGADFGELIAIGEAHNAAAMDQMGGGRSIVDAIGGLILSIAIVALLLNEILDMEQFSMNNGPMSGLDIGGTAENIFQILLLGVLIMAFVWIRSVWNSR